MLDIFIRKIAKKVSSYGLLDAFTSQSVSILSKSFVHSFLGVKQHSGRETLVNRSCMVPNKLNLQLHGPRKLLRRQYRAYAK